MEYLWIEDVSSNENFTLEQWKIKKEQGLKGIIARTSIGYRTDEMLANFVEAAHKINIPVAGYHFIDATLDIPKQVDLACGLVKKYGLTTLFGDMEQWWRDWNLWYKAVVQHQSVTVPVITPALIYKKNSEFITKAKSVLGDIGGYTAKWFVSSYCPDLAKLFNGVIDYNWFASYPYWKDPNNDKQCDWNEFWDFFNKVSEPLMPSGVTKWDIYQFADKLPIKGFTSMDMNKIKLSSYKKVFKQDPPDTVSVEPEPETAEETPCKLKFQVIIDPSEYLNIRSEPSTINSENIIGRAYTGDIFEGEDIVGKDAWLKTKDNSYICISKNSKKYMQPK